MIALTTSNPSAERAAIPSQEEGAVSRALESGRTWDRNWRGDDRLDGTGANFSRLLQGLLVDAEGRPVSLSATGFHSAVGQIRDMVAASDALREILEALLRGTAGR